MRRFLVMWILAFVVGACRAAGGDPESKQKARPLLKIKVKPGRYYQIVLPEGKNASAADPLSPMHRKRLIIKCDDLATWSLEAFQRFARLIDQHDAKAGFGIVPAQCDDKVFVWMKTLDTDRFEIWNHTWTHGKGGPNHYQQPYDVQWRNLTLAHDKVLERTGITMHTWCGGGIQHQGEGVHDQDDVTHWVVRNHPDYKVHFHANPKFADRGLGNINSDGMFIPWRHSWFENEWLNNDAPLVKQLKERWPDLDWNRPSALGNAEELKWRFDHPFWLVPESGKVDIMVAQFHPGSWDDEKLKALGELFEYVKSKGDWQFANAYDTYTWLMDKNDIAVQKISPTEYRLDAKSARFEHALELDLPPDAAVREHVYHVKAFEKK